MHQQVQADKEKLNDINAKLKSMKHKQQEKNEQLKKEELALTDMITKKSA
jgi:hypothetical protein